MTGGRPLRFLAMTLGGWITLRVAVLWPGGGPLPAIIDAVAPPAMASAGPVASVPTSRPAGAHAQEKRRGTPLFRFAPEPARLVPSPAMSSAVQNVTFNPAQAAQSSLQPPPLRPAPLATPPDRWALSAWTILRDGSAGALPNGQLGGSQAGARITYALDGRGRFALAARISTPLAGRGAEAAFGIDWRPTAAPIHLVAERRVSLDGGRSRPAAFVIGGLDPTPVAAGFRLEAYGQAGAVGGVGAFADGAARLTLPVAKAGGLRLELGAGAWGGAQPGAARLDVGPSAAAVLPVAGRSVRVTLDWRRRVAGDAAPGSGPALTIGGDF